MASALYLWAAGERYEINSDLEWFNAGAKLLSPSGKDITMMKVGQLNDRLRVLDQALRDTDDA